MARKTWTNKEDQFIMDNYGKYSIIEFSTLLERTKSSIEKRIARKLFLYITEEQKEEYKKLLSKQHSERQLGENNPYYKNGISKNYYHYKKLQVERYPNRVRAREKVKEAIKKGVLLPNECEICQESKVQAHHDDYSKPLEVRWLCKKCHNEWHKNNIAKE